MRHSDIPFADIVSPDCTNNFGVELNLFVEAILGSDFPDVLPDLGPFSIKGAPVRVRSKRESVDMSRNLDYGSQDDFST